MPLKINHETNYSADKNRQASFHEGWTRGPCKTSRDYAKPGFLELGVAPEQAPDTPAYITIHFEKGKPTALAGKVHEGQHTAERAETLRAARKTASASSTLWKTVLWA